MKMLYEIGEKPTKFQLNEGEEAFNVKDKKRYTKDKWDNIILIDEVYTPKLFRAYANTIQNAQTAHNILWANPIETDTTYYSFSTGARANVTILKTGLYKINVTASYANTGADRAQLLGIVRIDGIPAAYGGTRAVNYSRGLALGDEICLVSVGYLDLVANEVITYNVSGIYLEQVDAINTKQLDTSIAIELIKEG